MSGRCVPGTVTGVAVSEAGVLWGQGRGGRPWTSKGLHGMSGGECCGQKYNSEMGIDLKSEWGLPFKMGRGQRKPG